MRRTKANRALTFVMAAALLIGSIHGVGAKEQSKAYDAPELTLTQGASDYDLTAGITYDSEKYTLSVTDTGNFDINVVGDYEISYTLTGKENSVEETESVENTESTEKTETTETVSDTETVDTTENKDTDQKPEDNSQADGKDGADGADVSEPESGNQADGVDSENEKPDADKNAETGSGTDSSAEAQQDVTIEEEQTPKADTSNIEGNGSKQKTINFKRIVHVIATEDTEAEDEIATMSLDGARAANSDKINLGNAIWLDDTHGKYQFPNATTTITTASLMTIYVSDGSMEIPEERENERIFTNINNNSITYVWLKPKTKNEVESILRKQVFVGTSINNKITVIVDQNETSGDGWEMITRKNSYFSYFWNVNYDKGVYALYVDGNKSWGEAYKDSDKFTLAGYKGYLMTPVYNKDKNSYVTMQMMAKEVLPADKGAWVGATSLVDKQGNQINKDTDISEYSYPTIYSSLIDDFNIYKNSTTSNFYKLVYENDTYYFTGGPLKGKYLKSENYGSGQILSMPYRIFFRNYLMDSDESIPAKWTEPNAIKRNGSDTANMEPMNSSSIRDSCAAIYNFGKSANESRAYDLPYGNLKSYDSETKEQPASGYLLIFGGYPENQDPGGRKEELCETATVTVNNVYDAEVKIIDSQNNEVKYGPLADALDVAQAGEIVEIIKDTVTPATDAILKKDVQLKSNGRSSVYTGDTDTSRIDVAADGKVTLTDGRIKASDNSTLNVKSPIDGNTYQITTPSGASHVWVPKGSVDETPCVYNEKIGGTSDLTIGDAKYTFSNKSLDDLTLVHIPDAMYKEEMVTKAEVPADRTATVKLEDGDRNTITVKGGGSASDTVTVERRANDKQKADVTLPADVTANVFGHEIGAVPAGGVKVSHATGTGKYPDRDFVTIKNDGEQIQVDGVSYTAEDVEDKVYLGTFNVNITTGTDAEISNGKPADPHYLESYTVKITPKTGYDLDKDNFTVTMKKTDRASDGENVWSVAKHNFDDVCTVEQDGSITVKLDGDRVVTGDITINAAAKRQMTTIKVTGLTDNGAKGTYKAVQSGNEYTPNKDGEITVNRNEEVTFTFTPDDFDNSYYSELTGEKGESFSILTGLTETSNNDTDLFNGMKDTFNWTEKSYELKYTPTTANTELKAAFTPSHIVHIHVTGGTAEVTDADLLKKETAVPACHRGRQWNSRCNNHRYNRTCPGCKDCLLERCLTDTGNSRNQRDK